MKLIEIQRERWKKLVPSQEILDVEVAEHLDDWEIIESLGDNYACKFALIHRFGLFGETPKTLQEIAELTGFAYRERIRQYEVKALRYLRHPSRVYLYPFIRNENLLMKITGYRTVRDYILYMHFSYEEYYKLYN